MLTLDGLAGGVWVPIEVRGHPIEPVAGAFWSIGARADVVVISGFDGCNEWGLDWPVGAPPPTLVSGRLVDVTVWQTLAACEGPQVHEYPGEGSAFWMDGQSDELVVWPTHRPGGWIRLQRAESPTPEPSPPDDEPDPFAEEQRRLDAERDEFIADEADRRVRLRAELPVARGRWSSAGLTAYTLRFETASLQRDPSFPERAIGGVEEVHVVDGATVSPWAQSVLGGTVDDWFEFIEAQLDVAWALEVEFHPELGHPTLIQTTTREWTTPDDPAPFASWLVRAEVVAR